MTCYPKAEDEAPTSVEEYLHFLNKRR